MQVRAKIGSYVARRAHRASTPENSMSLAFFSV